MLTNKEKNTPVQGPKGLPWLGNIGVFWGNRLETFYNTFKEYGEFVPLTLGGGKAFLVTEPDGIKHVLQDNNKNYTKGLGYAKIEPFVGKGLLTSEGDFWRQQRRLAQPAFHRKKIANFAEIMRDSTAKMLAAWETQDEVIDLAEEMMRLTLDIVSRTLFSTAVRPDEFETVARILPPLLEEADKRAVDPFGLREKLPLPAARQFDAHIEALDAIVFRIIEERRQSGEDLPDLLGMLMAAQDEETGLSMSDEQLRDEVMTIFLAGHETTALNLTWTYYLLSQNPKVERRLAEEVTTILGEEPIDLEQLGKLRYTRAVIDEGLRLYPPAWAIARLAQGDDVVCGAAVPADSVVLISPYVMHRHPDYWPEPERFMPERFLDSEEGGMPDHRYAYLPFGGGPRLCIGNQFALMEGTIILAMIAQRYHLALEPGTEVVPAATITLRPKDGLRMRKTRR